MFINSKHFKITCKQLLVLLFTTHSPSGLGFHVKFVKMHVVQHLHDNPISNHVKALLCNRSYGNRDAAKSHAPASILKYHKHNNFERYIFENTFKFPISNNSESLFAMKRYRPL